MTAAQRVEGSMSAEAAGRIRRFGPNPVTDILQVGAMRKRRWASAAVGRTLFRHGRHRCIGLGCPGGTEHGNGRIRYDARDDPSHQRKVIAEHLNERESGERADDSAECESDRNRGCKAAGAQEAEARHRDLHAVACDHDWVGGDRVHSEECEQRHRGRIVADADAHEGAEDEICHGC